MTALRFIPLPIHSALEMLVGLLLGIAPFALGLGTSAAFAGVIAGVLVAGLALQTLDTGAGAEPHVAAHRAADQGIALGLAAAGAVMAFAGDAAAAGLFALAASSHVLLILATRYTSR